MMSWPIYHATLGKSGLNSVLDPCGQTPTGKNPLIIQIHDFKRKRASYPAPFQRQFCSLSDWPTSLRRTLRR